MAKTKISAMLHTCNVASQLERCLDSLRPCDEVIVIDHGSTDDTVKIAREYGARVIQGVSGVDHGAYTQDVRNDWVLVLCPNECVGEDLEASLFEWREAEPAAGALGYNIGIREQTNGEWKFQEPEMRLANRKQINWTGDLPPSVPNAPALQGHITRIKDNA